MEPICSNCSEPGKVKCYCKDPEQILCISCLEKHIIIPGLRHITKEITDRKEPSCSLCKQNMEIICLCQDKKTRLCHNCLLPHMSSNPSIGHSIEPGLVDTFLDDQEDVFKFLNKKKIIDALIAETRGNFLTIEKFKETLKVSKQNIIESVEKTVDEALKKAEQLEEMVHQMISLLESKKFTQNNNGDWAESLIKNSNSENIGIIAKNLKFLIGEVDKDSVLNTLKNLADLKIVKNPIKDVPTAYYIKPKIKEIFFTDSSSLKTNKVHFPAGLVLKELGAWCEVSSGLVAYCGGKENNNFFADFFIVDIIDSTFKKYPNMIEPRVYPGVLYHNCCVYVFGGFQGKISLKTCEKFDFIEKK